MREGKSGEEAIDRTYSSHYAITLTVGQGPCGRSKVMLGRDGVDPRTWHYREFYGLSAPASGAGVVLGNCQAESLRIVLDAPETPTLRIPPVHEMTAADIPHLDRALRSASFVITQPIRDDYRDLPVGTAHVRARVASSTRVVVVPVVRYTGLHPFQLIIRRGGLVEDPPLVPYHDVRGLARAAGVRVRPELAADAVRTLAAASVAELSRRERSAGAMTISDVFATPTFDQMRTINHPGNALWMSMGARVLEALGESHVPTDPDRPLLASIHAPREGWVAEAWGLDEAPQPDWIVDGVSVTGEVVAEAHARWYRDRPDVVRAALVDEAATVRLWSA